MDEFTADGLARIDAIVADAVTAQQAPGVVAAVARGDAVHVAVAGEATLGGAPMARDTLFRIASITKPMTATAVLSLAADGLLDLDEPIERWLPEFAERRVLRAPDGPLTDTVPARRQPTVRDLLTFTWGFGMQGAMFTGERPWPIQTATDDRELVTIGPPQPARLPDPDVWLARFGELPLMVQPGEKWLYQCGAQVLGLLAGRAAGMSFADVMQERVLAPLGMTDTAFHVTDVDRLATAYARIDGELVVTDPPHGQWSRPPAFGDGSAGLVSSVDDLVRFGRMLARGGGPVLGADAVAEMTRNQLTDAQRHDDWGGFDFLGDALGWGYGLAVYADGRYTWDGGLGTAWSNLPSHDLTVVVLTQRAWDETGPPAVGADVLAAAKEGVYLMVRNVVVGRLGDPADEDRLAAGLAGIASLRLPGLLAMHIGRDLGLREGGWTFAITNDWVDADAYRHYDTDPEHNRYRAMIAESCSDLVRVQFEVTG